MKTSIEQGIGYGLSDRIKPQVFKLIGKKMNNKSKKLSITFPQEPLWKETLDIISAADSVRFLTDPKGLSECLSFNSIETRKRYGRAIATRFSRIDPRITRGLVDITKAEVGTDVIEQIWRVLFCMAEPLVAQVYLELIWPREPGSSINRNEIKSYIETAFQQQSAKLNQRTISCLQHCGYLIPNGKQDLIVVSFGNPEDALILSTYLILAQTPRTIKLSEIESANYWRFLGYRKFDHVRLGFRSAEAKGLIMRYANVDHLEQITTRYTLRELLAQKV